MFGFVSLVLFFDPSLLGLSGEDATRYRSKGVWLLVGVGFIGFGILVISWTPRWSRRSIWIYKHVAPVDMNIVVERKEWSDSTDYTVAIESNEGARWNAPVMQPSWDTGSIEKKRVPARVYFDPRSNRPAIVETQPGILWLGRVIGGPRPTDRRWT